MIVTKIRLIGLYTVDLPIVVAQPSDHYIIKAADGLGAPGYDVSIVGSVYQGRVPRNREMVFRIGLNPDFKINQTAAQLRDQLYGMLSPANNDSSVTIQFLNKEQVVASTQGWVSNIEPVLFAKEPEVQLTFPCNAAYLIAPEAIQFVPADRSTFSIVNAGTAPTGIELEVTFTKNMSEWAINFGDAHMTLDYDFKIGDVLKVDTRANNRSIRVTRAGVEKEIIFSLTRSSVWINLHGGTNTFTTSAQNFNWSYVRYTPLYEGV